MAADPAQITPRPITRLPSDVVNRIAAGEIIQRPANALKELIENALDAGATSIKVTVKEGGTKLLQIQDNGGGIRKEDLAILCERFTTSKIKAYEDLVALNTYGFRGEALASISHVAHLTVTTKTRLDHCAWKVSYSDGCMKALKPGGQAEPVPFAGNDGTLIVVEDLFFNTPTRLKSLRSSTEEYNRIIDLLTKYSIHNAGISIVCKKAGSAVSDVQTTIGASVLDNIGLHYGESVKKELIKLDVDDRTLGAKASGWFSGANYSAKKGNFLFFINHRLVECPAFKRAFEAFYATLLPKNGHPFVYLDLEIDPHKIDVNVHPTKQAVNFLDEEEIVQLVCEKLQSVLASGSESRSYNVQTLLPGAKKPTQVPTQSTPTVTGSSSSKATVSTSTTRKTAPNKLVRTDHSARTLDTMFSQTQFSTLTQSFVSATDRPSKRRKEGEAAVAEEIELSPKKVSRIGLSACKLKSVQELRKEVTARMSEGLDVLVKNHIFVGVADVDTSLSMIQHATKLYLVNHASLSEELLYQLGLRQFGRFNRIKLQPAPPLRQLIRLAVDQDESSTEASLSSEEIVDKIYDQLMSSREMLEEYFSFLISSTGDIESLPLLLPGFNLNINNLPLFLLRLGVQVNWTDEKLCFETFLQELAYFYVAPSRRHSPPSMIDPTYDAHVLKESERIIQSKRQLEHVVFPAAKLYLETPERMIKANVFVMTTSLESLYKVFERC